MDNFDPNLAHEVRTGRWIVAMTGASGVCYAIELVRALIDNPRVKEIHLLISEAGFRVLNEEHGLKIGASSASAQSLFGVESDKVCFHNSRDVGASVASGSFLCDGMVVIPCSMSTLGSIANGVPMNLIHRSADVTLKERRRLILVPRETPLSAIHLENLLKLARLGVTILPAMPGFYQKPESIQDLVKALAMKVLDAMRIPNELAPRWGTKSN